ncbi:MAG: hypothetical protein Q8Q08_09195 [Candidatus Omnitrophota bacterium]|nr:hypothetical protein [Candidatus Omnitrophota bacterium]MDZ4242695.1 hypothetical protein [Candidatus Omnitrophota bacterium]
MDKLTSGAKAVLKFDVGADGFLKMIGVLAVTAVILAAAGAVFFLFFYRPAGSF